MDKVTHGKTCEENFGKPFAEVHDFLDQYSPRFPREHRILYHHKQGLKFIEKEFGPEAVQAAESHIAEDEGFVPEDHTHFHTENEELLNMVRELYPEKKLGWRLIKAVIILPCSGLVFIPAVILALTRSFHPAHPSRCLVRRW